MAKPILLTDFQDDVISESMNGKRRYRMENNTDGTISLEDVTEYEQVGNSYGAGQINATNEAVNQSLDANKLIKDLDTIGALTEEGYVPDALAVKSLNDSLAYWIEKGYLPDPNNPYFQLLTLAYGTITASSDGGGSYNAEKVLDNDDITFWTSAWGTSSANLIFAFHEPHTIKKIRFKPHSAEYTTTLKISISTNGSTFSEIYLGNPTTNNWIEIIHAVENVQKIKFEVTGTNQVALYGVEAYGY